VNGTKNKGREKAKKRKKKTTVEQVNEGKKIVAK